MNERLVQLANQIADYRVLQQQVMDSLMRLRPNTPDWRRTVDHLETLVNQRQAIEILLIDMTLLECDRLEVIR